MNDLQTNIEKFYSMVYATYGVYSINDCTALVNALNSEIKWFNSEIKWRIEQAVRGVSTKHTNVRDHRKELKKLRDFERYLKTNHPEYYV